LAHAPAQVVPVPVHEALDPWVGPEATGEQVPSLPGRSQAIQRAAQAWSQQYPSGLQGDPATQPPVVVPQVWPRLLLQAPVASQVPAQRPLGSSLPITAAQVW